ncbi:MAG: SixA phosphatase family protein [Candidatus Eiseniibacteriota bacterium]
MPLVLDLLRHGATLPAAAGGDEARPLSSRGMADLERLASRLEAMGWRPDRAFASPLRRAHDSAVIALRVAAPGLEVEPMDALRPDGDPAGVLEALAAAGATAGHVLLVGHQPLLGLLAAHLNGGPAPGFTPGSLVRIEFAGPPAAGQGVTGWRLAAETAR